MATGSAPEELKPVFYNASQTDDGWSKDGKATATCFCGAVQLAFPTEGPGFFDSFVCNCCDCHKITASMHASNFTIADTHLEHLRGRENLKSWGQSKTIGTGNTMTNFFCSTCGVLMYRVSSGFPGYSILRIGTVDDFSLHDTALKPTVEQFIEHRVAWKPPMEGVKQVKGESHAF